MVMSLGYKSFWVHFQSITLILVIVIKLDPRKQRKDIFQKKIVLKPKVLEKSI